MPAHLQVTYTDASGGPREGAVAAWGKETHGDKEYQVLKGYADPIVAAQLIEEAIQDDGFVWIIGLSDTGEPLPATLGNLLLVWGSDIHSGRVHFRGGNVDAPPPRQPDPQGTEGHDPAGDHGPGEHADPPPNPNHPTLTYNPNARR